MAKKKWSKNWSHQWINNTIKTGIPTIEFVKIKSKWMVRLVLKYLANTNLCQYGWRTPSGPPHYSSQSISSTRFIRDSKYM